MDSSFDSKTLCRLDAVFNADSFVVLLHLLAFEMNDMWPLKPHNPWKSNKWTEAGETKLYLVLSQYMSSLMAQTEGVVQYSWPYCWKTCLSLPFACSQMFCSQAIEDYAS